MKIKPAQEAASGAEFTYATPAGMPTLDPAIAEYESATPEDQTRMLSQLVCEVYENAPLPVRGLLLDKLLRPIGVLSLVTLAGGIFAKIRFRSALQAAPLRIEDIEIVGTRDVLALVDRVQQASDGAMDGLNYIIATSPVLARSAAAYVLSMVLIKSSRVKRVDDFDA